MLLKRSAKVSLSPPAPPIDVVMLQGVVGATQSVIANIPEHVRNGFARGVVSGLEWPIVRLNQSIYSSCRPE